MTGKPPIRKARHQYKRWNSAEIDELRDLYGTTPATELATRYGVTPQQLRAKASDLGLANQRVKARNRAAQQLRAKASDLGLANQRVKARNRAAQQAVEEAKECKQRTAHGEQRITAQPGYRVITHTMR